MASAGADCASGTLSLSVLLSSSALRGIVKRSCIVASSSARLRTMQQYFEGQAVGIFEVDRLSPSVIVDVGDLYALRARFVALLRKGSCRTGLEGKMIEAGWDTEPAIDARVVFSRYARNSVRFQKGDELIAPNIEKEVSKKRPASSTSGTSSTRSMPSCATRGRATTRHWPGRHCQLSCPWYARCVGGAAARVGRSFARLLCCPALTERGRKKAPWVR